MRVFQDATGLEAAQVGDQVWLDTVGGGTQTLYEIVRIDDDNELRLHRVEPITFRRAP